MGITTFYFFCFLAVALIVYYSTSAKYRWVTLLVISIVYFLTTGAYVLILYPVASVLLAYVSTNEMCKRQDEGSKKPWMLLGILGNLLFLIVLKYLNFFVYTYNGLVSRFRAESQLLSTFRFMVPLGLSFYTLSILGYIFDVYYGKYRAEKNFFKLLLFGMYFPTIVTGPLVRYDKTGKELIAEHRLDYNNITFGLQRMLWGLLKVLVISERLSVVVSSVYDDYRSYTGIYIILATVLFAFQLYTNFSGSIDIVMGVSECFGIKLPENFKVPFLSRSVTEFWRRWHITLGLWFKDYVFYPILRTRTFIGIPAKLKGRVGKKAAKRFATFLAMLIMWLLVGLWHGGSWKYIVGSGVLHWMYILLEDVCEPLGERIRNRFSIDKDAVWIKTIQIFRTYLLVCIGFVFFNANSMREGFDIMSAILFGMHNGVPADGSALSLGLELREIIILGVSLIIMMVIEVLSLHKDMRIRIASYPVAFRWIIYYCVVFYVILLGQYGPGYSATEFIYKGF